LSGKTVKETAASINRAPCDPTALPASTRSSSEEYQEGKAKARLFFSLGKCREQTVIPHAGQPVLFVGLNFEATPVPYLFFSSVPFKGD